MKEFIKVMRALSDPNRVNLLKLLQRREMCVCEIQASLGIAQPTVSKHLKSLVFRRVRDEIRNWIMETY